MAKLTLREGRFNIRKLIGILWIIAGVVMLFTLKNSLGNKSIYSAIAFLAVGILYFTPLVGSGKYIVEEGDDGTLVITWYSWIRRAIIPESDIRGIELQQQWILIKRKEKKNVRMSLYGLERDEKSKVYEFFSEYSKRRNIPRG